MFGCRSHPCTWSGWYIPDHQLNDVDWSLPQAVTTAYARVGNVNPQSKVNTKWVSGNKSNIILAFHRAYDLEPTFAQLMNPPLKEDAFKKTTEKVQSWPMGGLEDGTDERLRHGSGPGSA